MPQNKNPIQQRIEEERSKSPANTLTPRQIAQQVGNLARAEGVRANRDKISQGIKNSLAYKQGIADRDQSFRQDPKYQKAHKQRMQDLRKDPEFVEKQKKGVSELRNDPQRLQEYKERNRQGYLKAKESEEYWSNYYAGIERREADKSYHKGRIEKANAVICRKVHAGDLGDFDSITLAARAHGMTNTETMRNRLKSPNFPDYYYLDDNVRPKKK